MRKTRSIAARLAIALTLSAALLWLVSVGIAAIVLRSELNAAFDDTMRQSALRLLPLAVHELDDMMDGDIESDDANFIASLTAEGANLDYYILNPDNRVLIFSSEERPTVTDTPVPLGFSDRNDNRLYALKEKMYYLR